MWQEVVIGVLVVATAGYVARHFLRIFRAQTPHCPGCAGCSGGAAERCDPYGKSGAEGCACENGSRPSSSR
jgi:hypothetical protein